jgi:hypothetical protein
MKTKITLLAATLLIVTSAFCAAPFADAEFVKGWSWENVGTMQNRCGKPVLGQDVDAAVVKKTTVAVLKTGLAPASLDFDAVYATLGTANVFESKANGKVCNERPWNDINATDFVGEWKAAYDDGFLYVFLKYADDIDTGAETVEVMWSNAFKIDAPDTITTVRNLAGSTPSVINGRYQLNSTDSTALFWRFAQFGGYKAAFTVTNGFKDAMEVVGGPKGASTSSYTARPDILVNNLAFFNKTDVATPLLKKHIMKIGFGAFTGIYRPDFNNDIWNTLNNNRGLSFEISVKDLDNDEVIDPALPTSTKKEAAGYFWNNKMGYLNSPDVWYTNQYAGFLKNDVVSGLKNTIGTANSIFSKQTSERIDLNRNANVIIFNALGKSVKSINNTNFVNLSSLSKGVYVIRANNEVVKIVR